MSGTTCAFIVSSQQHTYKLMEPFKILSFLLVFLLISCGGGDPAGPGFPVTDPPCPDDISYRLYVTKSDGSEMLTINSGDYDPSMEYQLQRLSNFLWGIEIEGSSGMTRVELGLPETSCGTSWRKNSESSPGGPRSFVYNTGEPLLKGYSWENITATGSEPFSELTVQGEVKTAVLTENLEVLVNITGPEDADGETCLIEHVIHFEVVK